MRSAFFDDPVVQGAGGLALIEFLGLRSDGPGVVGVTITPRLLNGLGMLIGPVGFALVDFSMSSALWAATTEEEELATLSVALNFVHAARAGEVVCRSAVDRRNRRVATLRSTVEHEDGRVLMTAVGSFSIYPATARLSAPALPGPAPATRSPS